ncbi:metallophosphoesterase family protein [Alicyclobacillus fastidiosus]|uniref:DNA repair exonuclease n=1 Tax=Alicyclobacillus fastidiosus TaxID=392011 RepID=A0ABV5ACZ5_9BACL|nr:DNA repair exonuclease [Alicyclobacillus fastidiosus]WEH11237.1 DNA repair exonuclease [Alicyclobacillus fastidiosus]
MLRILHTADLHVGTPFKLRASQLPDSALEQLRLAAGTVLQRIVDYAIEKRLDAVIIAGDLFDEADPPVSVQYAVYRQFRRLAERGIPVVLSHGNHDPVGAASLFPWPSTVHVLGGVDSGERVCDILLPLGGCQVQFSGFSYATRELYGSKVAQFARREGADIAIALYHGQVGSASGSHAPYAATSLGELLSHGDFDVWALGHIHGYRVLHEGRPFVAYSGSPQGRDAGEAGRHGGILLTWDEQLRLSHSFIPFSTVEWQRVNVDVTGLTTFEAVWAATATKLDRDSSLRLIDLHLSGQSPLSASLNLPEARSIFQQAADDDGYPVWIHRYASTVEAEIDWRVWEAADGYVGQLMALLRQVTQHPEEAVGLLDGIWSKDEIAIVEEAIAGDPESVLEQVRQILLSQMRPEQDDLELVEWRGVHAATGSAD